jgi:hypothetical protein
LGDFSCGLLFLPMARASTINAPPAVPFWRLSAFRWGLAVVGLAVLIAAGGWLERTNRTYQLERRLEENPSLGPMVRRLKQQIEQAKNSGLLKDPAKAALAQAPQALWLGRIQQVIENETRDGSTIVLAEPQLLAGRAGTHDRGGEVRIGRRKFVFSPIRPKAGELWLISVWRDGADSVVHSAAHYTP